MFNRKSLFKRAVSLLMAATLTFGAVPMQSFADGNLDSNAGGSDGTGVQTGSGGDFGCNVGTEQGSRIGFRMSLVNNKNPQEIISIDDNGNPLVVDFLYCTKQQFALLSGATGNYFTPIDPNRTAFSSVKTQDQLLTEFTGGPKIHRIYLDNEPFEFPDKNGETGTLDFSKVEPWMKHNGSYNPTGEAFVDWCSRDSYGNVAIGANGNLRFTIDVYGIQKEVTVSKDSAGNLTADVDSVLGAETYKCPGDPVRLVEGGIKELDGYLRDLLADPDDVYHKVQTSGYTKKIESASTQTKTFLKVLDETKHSQADALFAKYNKTIDDIVAIAPTLDLDRAVRTGITKDAIESDGGTWSPMSAKEMADKLASSGTGGDAGATGTLVDPSTLGYAHISQFLLIENGDNYLFQTKNTKGTGLSVLDEAVTDDWVLLVEPIVFLTICKYGSLGRPQDRVMNNKLYGTVTNVLQALTELPELKSYANTQHFNWKAFKEIWYPLHVVQSEKGGFEFGDGVKDENGQVIKEGSILTTIDSMKVKPGNSYVPNDLINKNNGKWIDGKKAGWGVNVYWGKGMKEPGRTWDIPLPEPGPPSEKQKVPEGTGIKVVKWYVVKTYEADGTISEIVTDVKVDDNHPREIMVENEGVPGEGYFYQVSKWATGKNDVVPENDDTNTTFEQYHKKNPGQQGGLGPDVVEVANDEKVLYLKLLVLDWLDDWEPGDVTVIKVKDPATGASIIEKDTANPGTVYPAGEVGWEYIEDIQTPNPEVPVTNWNDVPKTPGTPGSDPTSWDKMVRFIPVVGVFASKPIQY